MRYIIGLLLVVAVFIPATAQELTDSIQMDLKELATPATPAFTLLGISPTDVSRPSLARTFGLDIANALGSNGSIGKDVAIETSPYWWFSHPNLTYSQYYGLTEKQNDSLKGVLNHGAANIWQSLSLSLATNDPNPDVDSIDSRNLAGGFRFQPIRGQASKAFASAYNEKLTRPDNLRLASQSLKRMVNTDGIITSYQALKDSAFSQLAKLVPQDDSYQQYPPDSISEIVKVNQDEFVNEMNKYNLTIGSTYDKTATLNMLDSLQNRLTSIVVKTKKEMKSISRVGWIAEIAGAGSLFLPTNNINFTYGNNWGFWGTLTHRFDYNKKGNINEFNLMLRYGGDFQQSNAYNRDIGLSWVVSGENYSLTVEGVFRQYRTEVELTLIDGTQRTDTEKDNTSRYALAFQYRLSDLINLTATVGKNYANDIMTGGNIFTLVNAGFLLPSNQSIVK